MGTQDDLMEENAAETQRRIETMAMYKAMKEALTIINDVNMNTKGEDIPPPVDNDKYFKDIGNSRPVCRVKHRSVHDHT